MFANLKSFIRNLVTRKVERLNVGLRYRPNKSILYSPRCNVIVAYIYILFIEWSHLRMLTYQLSQR